MPGSWLQRSVDEPSPVIFVDPIDFEVHVHAVGHRPLMGVLHHQVLVKETERVLGRGRGEADQVRVEVLGK